MKSLVLQAIAKPDKVRGVLDQLLPGQREPWLLLAKEGDPIAYFHLEPDGSSIQADISGRHYNEDDAVSKILIRIAAVVGGRIDHD